MLCLIWTDGSFASLKEDDEARLLALYLFTNEHGSMIGLSRLALPTMLHELGPQWDRARFVQVLARLSELDIAHYDYDAELLYLPAAARTQIAESLKPADNRVKSVVKQLARFRGHSFHHAFVERYRVAFSLPKEVAGGRSLEAPSKPLRSPLQGPTEAPSKPEAEAEAGSETSAVPRARAREPHHDDEPPAGSDPDIHRLAKLVEATPASHFDRLRPEWFDAAGEALGRVADSVPAGEPPAKTLSRVADEMRTRARWVNDGSYRRRREEHAHRAKTEDPEAQAAARRRREAEERQAQAEAEATAMPSGELAKLAREATAFIAGIGNGGGPAPASESDDHPAPGPAKAITGGTKRRVS